MNFKINIVLFSLYFIIQGAFALPKNVSFKWFLDRPFSENSSVIFYLYYKNIDYKFERSDVQLSSVTISGRTYTGDVLKLLKKDSFSSDSKGDIRHRWSLSLGRESFFPIKNGNYKVSFKFDTPKGEWEHEATFRRKCDNEKLALSFYAHHLYKFCDPELYKKAVYHRNCVHLLKFYKAVPKSGLMSSVIRNLTYTGKRSVYRSDFNEETIKSVCSLLNRVGNVELWRFIRKEAEGSRSNDQEYMERLNTLRKRLVKETTSKTKELTLVIPNLVRPYASKVAKIYLESKDSSLRNLKFYRATIGSKSVDKGAEQDWDFKYIEPGKYECVVPEKIIPGKPGVYRVKILALAIGKGKVYELVSNKFEVRSPKLDLEALKFYREKKLTNIINLKGYDKVKLKTAWFFLNKYKDSYLKDIVVNDLISLALKDLYGKVKLTKAERRNLAKCLACGNCSYFLYVASFSLKRYSSLYFDKVAEWFELLAPSFKELPPEFSIFLNNKSNELKVGEKLELNLKWNYLKLKDLKLDSSKLYLIAWYQDGVLKPLPRFGGSRASNNFKTIKYSSMLFSKAGTYNLTLIFYTGHDVLKTPNISVTVARAK